MIGHPQDRDIINFATDRLGEHKKGKILAHCRECPTCADRLIEATREHAPAPGPIKLSRWNKISLVALALALAILVVTLVMLVRSLEAPVPVSPDVEIVEPR